MRSGEYDMRSCTDPNCPVLGKCTKPLVIAQQLKDSISPKEVGKRFGKRLGGSREKAHSQDY